MSCHLRPNISIGEVIEPVNTLGIIRKVAKEIVGTSRHLLTIEINFAANVIFAGHNKLSEFVSLASQNYVYQLRLNNPSE